MYRHPATLWHHPPRSHNGLYRGNDGGSTVYDGDYKGDGADYPGWLPEAAESWRWYGDWRLKLYGSDGAYTEATVCGGGGQGCVKLYKRDCFLCQLFISVTSRVLDEILTRKRHRLLQQIDTFQLHLFMAQLTLVNNSQQPIATGKEWRDVCGQSLSYWEDHFMASMNSCCMS